MTNPKTKPICEECGSDQIMIDAYARWSIDQQEWTLAGTLDHSECGSCGHESNMGCFVMVPG